MTDTAAPGTFDVQEPNDGQQPLALGATLQMPGTAALPVGTILAYAGRFPDSLQAAGWYPCRGQSVSTTGELAELFAAIGFAFGQTAPTQFSLPDLRGWFQRATTASSAVRGVRDPDWESRRPAPSIMGRTALLGAAIGSVGTTQLYGTAPPRQSFTASVDHLNITNANDDAGCADRPGSYNNDTQTFAATGGDLESRPVNKYVAYLIKGRSVSGPTPVTLPVGVLVPFAGQMGKGAPQPPIWRACQGGALNTADAPELFDAVNFIHGSVDGQQFVLPDYRGWFQRGVNADGRADPDADSRTVAYPAGKPGQQGNQGNNVGSAQAASTGAPTTAAFTTGVQHLPTSDASKRVAGFMYNLLRQSGGTKLIDLSSSGGDRESRPANMSVDWYILSSVLASPDVAFPIGGVAAMGCTLDANKFWLPCDGRSLPVSDYGALYTAVGNTYGGDAKTFVLPDYRGRFLRGASYTSGVDPDSATRVAKGTVPAGGVGTFQDWATGRPVKPFQGTIPHYPDSELGAHGVTNGGNAGNDGSLTFNTCTGGGDGETRPRNVYLNFYIRSS